MNLSRETFWDADYDAIDWEKNREWVICHVLDRGSISDWHEIKKHYGAETIIEAAKKARYLSKKTIHFLSNLFDIPLTEFRCYNLMQSHPERWIF